MQEEMAMLQQQQAQKSLIDQTGQLAGTPIMDPSKNPEVAEPATIVAEGIMGAAGAPTEEPPVE